MRIKDLDKFTKHEKYNSYKADDVKSTGLPYLKGYNAFIEKDWVNTEDIKETLILVTKTNADKIGEPINEDEEVKGFKRIKNGYVPLVHRPNATDKLMKQFYYVIKNK